MRRTDELKIKHISSFAQGSGNRYKTVVQFVGEKGKNHLYGALHGT